MKKNKRQNKTKVQQDIRVVKRKKPNQNENDYEAKREYSDTLQSFLKLKQGAGNEEYSELVMKAIEATDNIISMKSLQKEQKVGKVKTKVKATENDKTKKKGAKNVIELLEEVSVNANDKTHSNMHDNSAIEPVNADTQETSKLLCQLKDKRKVNETIGEKIINIVSDSKLNKNSTGNKIDELCTKLKEAFNHGESENGEKTPECKAKKLTSGRCTKPD